MRTNPLLATLGGVFLLCCLGTILLASRHFFALVELERVQAETYEARTTASYAQALANEALRYSEENPAIRPVLKPFQTEVSQPPAGAAAIEIPPEPSMQP